MSVILNDPTLGNLCLSTAEALHRLASRRDGEAWSAILQRHGADILRMAQRITGDSALCEDICQEALLQIRTYAGRFQPPENHHETEAAAKGWVMCIAYRTALGMLRIRTRRNQNETQAGLEQRAQVPDNHDPLLNSEQLDTLRREVAELPELLRSAVCLHFYGQMSFPEISSTLSCSEKAARKRVERGVKRLRDRLADGGLSLGVGALMITLGGTANAAAAGGTAAVSNLVAIQSLAKWQALLHAPTLPAMSGVAKIGVAAIMTKYVVGTAAVLALSLSGIQTYRLNSFSQKVSESQAAAVSSLQDKIDNLEKQLNESRGDTAALKSGLAARSEDVSRLEKAVQQNGQGGNHIYGFPGGGAIATWEAGGPADVQVVKTITRRIENGRVVEQVVLGKPVMDANGKFNPVGVWQKQDGATLFIRNDNKLNFVDSKGTWSMNGDKLILDFDKWGHKEITQFDNAKFIDGNDVFTRIADGTTPGAKTGQAGAPVNPAQAFPGQDVRVDVLDGGIVQYHTPDGKILMQDATKVQQLKAELAALDLEAKANQALTDARIRLNAALERPKAMTGAPGAPAGAAGAALPPNAAQEVPGAGIVDHFQQLLTPKAPSAQPQPLRATPAAPPVPAPKPYSPVKPPKPPADDNQNF